MQDAEVLGQTSFEEATRPHLAAMAWLAARLVPAVDRDDVVQEALTVAWRKADQFDPNRGSRQSWLLAITADQARKARRRGWRRPQESPGVSDAGYVDSPSDVDLERAIQMLPDRQRLAVALFYFLDLPVDEVAAVMQCAPGTVKATLSHARERLRRQLGKDFPWTS